MAFLCIPILFLPAVIGIALLFRNPDDRRTRMAALLTLKPYLTTPLWAILTAMGGANSSAIFAILGILPGALLSAWMYWVYQDIIAGDDMTPAARFLFSLDCFRWINSFFIGLSIITMPHISPSTEGILGPLAMISAFLGLALPSIFAIAALVATNRVPEKAKIKPKRKNDEESDEVVDVQEGINSDSKRRIL
jgi:hypothetical protein